MSFLPVWEKQYRCAYSKCILKTFLFYNQSKFIVLVLFLSSPEKWSVLCIALYTCSGYYLIYGKFGTGGPVLVKRCKSFFWNFEIKPFPSKVRALFPILKILSSTDEWFRRYKLYVDLYNSKFVTLIHKKDVCHTYTYFTN